MMGRTGPAGATAGLLITLAACAGSDGGQAEAPATPDTAAQVVQAPPPPPPLRLEVDVATRQVHVYRNDRLERSYGVAVGTSDWPTQNGEWTISQVVWNPRWVPPPDEEWADDEEEKDSGDPENPLGRVQIVYDAPRTIHGTNEPESIGKAASHGSIRMRNEEAAELARMVMEAGGAARDAAFFAEVERNRTRRYEVALPSPVPIRVINGVDNANAVEGEGRGSGGPPERSTREPADTASADTAAG